MPRPELFPAGRSAVIAFDSSTEWLSVALDLGPQGCQQRTEPGSARASARLLPLVQELLDSAGLGLHDVGLIGFGAGPGAFTGLRAACAAAQGLGYGLGVPVVGVDTLLGVAAGGTQSDVLVVNDARMGEVYWAVARRGGAEDWALLQAPRVQSPAVAAQAWVDWFGAEPPALELRGNAWAVHAPALREALGSSWQALLDAAQTAAPDACAIARLARAEHAAGRSVPAAQARPLYVRDKVALTSAERAELAHSRAAQR